MFFKRSAHLIVVCKSSFAGRLDAPIDAGELVRSGMVFSFPEASIDFERDLRKLGLRLFRPVLHALQHVSKYLGGHLWKCITALGFVCEYVHNPGRRIKRV